MGSIRRRGVRGVSRLLWPLLALLLRLLLRSWKIRVLGSAAPLDRLPESGSAAILAFWHSDLLPVGRFLQSRLVKRGVAVTGLVSRSADGEILARAAAGFGFEAIRGSTSRGGLAALRDLYRALGGGRVVVIAPDGPRGPARAAKPGIVQMALLSGVPIVPMAAGARRAWRARSWDRTRIPKPFAEVVVAVGEEIHLGRDADLARETERLVDVLRDLENEVEEATREA